MIKPINGTNVYVISADVPRATDGRGKSYSTFYTDLRWKIWAEVQASALKEIELDSAIYKAQVASINDQIKQQRKLIADLQSGALKAEDAAAIDKARFEKSMREAQARQTISTSVSTSSGTSSSGSASGGTTLEGKDKDLLDDIVVRASTDAADGTLLDYSNRLEQRVEDALGAGGGVNPDSHEAFRRDAVGDAVSKARATAVDNGLDPDEAERMIVEQFKPSFQAAWAAGGASARTPGGRSSTSSSVRRPVTPVTDVSAPDIPVASRAPELARLQAELRALENQRAAVVAPVIDPLQRTRDEFASRVGPGGFGTDPRLQRRQELFDEQAALEGAIKMLDYKNNLAEVEKTMQAARTKALAESSVTGVDPSALVQEIDNELARIRSEKSRLSPVAVPARDFLRRDVAAAPGRAQELEILGFEDDPALVDAPAGEVIELGPQGAQATDLLAPEPVMEPAVEPAVEPEPAYVVPPPNSRQALEAQALELTDEEVKELQNLGYAVPGRGPALAAGAAAAIPVAVERKVVAAPNQRERESNYKARVIMEGVSLAARRKKFERIAKQNLSDEERAEVVPEYVRLVEDIYNTSTNTGSDPVKNTYAEITRTYKDDPKTMRLAHVYLFAMDTVSNRKPE